MKIGNFGIGNVDALDVQLKRIGAAVATGLAEQATRQPAELLRDKWATAAPFDPEQRSKASRTYGHLKANIRVVKVKSEKVTYVAHDVTTGDAFWGVFVEYGTEKMAAQPWARPAAQALRPTMISMQIDILNRGIAAATA